MKRNSLLRKHRQDRGNVALELIFAILVLVGVCFPSVEYLADLADAKRDLSEVAAIVGRTWQPNVAGYRILNLVPLEKLYGRKFTLTTTCINSCGSWAVETRLTLTTTVSGPINLALSTSTITKGNTVG